MKLHSRGATTNERSQINDKESCQMNSNSDSEPSLDYNQHVWTNLLHKVIFCKSLIDTDFSS